MKKNKFLRSAFLLLIAVLVTSSVVSSTMARYTTSSSASDTARVAKFGVVATIGGSLFGEHYDAFEAGNGISAVKTDSVDSSDSTNVVAPGTKNDTGLVISVSGQPETACDITVTIDKTQISDIYLLHAGYFGIMVKEHGVTAANCIGLYTYDSASNAYIEVTDANAFSSGDYYRLTNYLEYSSDDEGFDGCSEPDNCYYPIKYYITKNDTTTTPTNCSSLNFRTDDGAADSVIYNVPFSSDPEGTYSVEPYILNVFSNLDLSTAFGEYKLTWEWPYSAENDSRTLADTILGSLIAYDSSSSEYQVVLKKPAANSQFEGLVTETDDNGIRYARIGGSTGQNGIVANLTAAFAMNISVTQAD